MKSIVLTGIRKLELLDITKPELSGKDDVILKVCSVGICGSDIHYYLEGGIGDQVVDYPFVIGHECMAVVDEPGDNVHNLKKGDLVVVDPAISCGQCRQCKLNRAHTCENLRFLGCPGEQEGALSEFIVVPGKCCYKINPKIPISHAMLVEPLSIAEYAFRLLNDSEVKDMAILGVGPIGLSVLLQAKRRNVASISITDKIDHRIKVAQDVGAQWGGNPDKSNIVAEIQKMNPEGMDVVFECCGDQEALNQAVEIVKPGGRLAIIGIPPSDTVTFDIHTLRRKELHIINVRRQNHCIQDAIHQIESKQVDVDFMVTHTFSFMHYRDAFETVAEYKDGVIKAIIQVNECTQGS